MSCLEMRSSLFGSTVTKPCPTGVRLELEMGKCAYSRGAGVHCTGAVDVAGSALSRDLSQLVQWASALLRHTPSNGTYGRRASTSLPK